MSTLLLSRCLFAFSLSFHIIFPAITIGMSLIIFIFEYRYFKTGDEDYLNLAKFWTKIFALFFGCGVLSGITLSFMFGLLFNNFSYIFGEVIGPLLVLEVLTAFFIESSFLGIMILGWNRISQKKHLFATGIVFLGTFISAFWILSANSVMHTPAGFEIKNGIAVPISWLKIIFNPSFVYRFTHMVNASFITSSCLMLGISSYMILSNRNKHQFIKCFKFCALFLLTCSIVQAFIGDMHGINTLKHQPAKTAAMESYWQKYEDGAPTILFAIPDQENGKNRFELSIPKLGSLILTHSLNGQVPVLSEFDKSEIPPVAVVFYSFRVMVGVGILLIVLSSIAYWRSRKNQIEKSLFFLKILSLCSPLGIIGVIAGWFVTEVGRQPWIIYGVMRVSSGLTPNLDYSVLVTSAISIVFIYISILITAMLTVRYILINNKKYD